MTRPSNGTAGISRSAVFLAMQAWIERVAISELPVLIVGETGSGKERVARSIHACSRRHAGPFVAVNCAAFHETLLDSELFGAIRGAYTDSRVDRPGLIRSAGGGSLFLDEIGEMHPSMQARLLRALQERTVRPVGGIEEIPIDVRIISATHRDLAPGRTESGFREDLYYRLSTLEVQVPPLRERLEDLELLVRDLSGRIRRETGWEIPAVSLGAWEALRAHPWPGNVRELHAVLARAVLRTDGARIEARHLKIVPDSGPAEAGDDPAGGMEQQMIVLALQRSSGNLARAAERIGWSRQKLYRRMEALSLNRKGPRAVPRRNVQPSAAGARSSGSSTFQ